METNPRDYGERCRFDAFCKTVLKHEASLADKADSEERRLAP